MSTLILPDSVSLNEIRIAKEHLKEFHIRKCYFAPNQRKLLGKILREDAYISVFTGTNCVFLMATKQDTPKITERLSEDVNLQISRDVTCFADLPEEIARRFIFAFIKKTAEGKQVYQGDGWQLFSLTTRFEYGYYAVDVGIRDEKDYYTVYLDPTVLVLLPLTSIPRSALQIDRSLMRIVAAADEVKMQEWKHSCYPGHVGLFVKLEDSNQDNSSTPLAPDDAVIVKRTLASEDTLRYPTFALRVVGTNEEVSALGLTKTQKKASQFSSQARLKETQQWAKKLFPDNVLVVNNRQIPVINQIDALQEAKLYRKGTRQNILWYPDTRLLFSEDGTKHNYKQLKGLIDYGPFDYNSKQKRPFNKIQPYLIVPSNPELVRLSSDFFQLLENGYTKRENTSFPDVDFPGISAEYSFRVEFVSPTQDDMRILDDGSIVTYTQAAKSFLLQWAGSETKSNNRIAVVVVPNLYSDEADDTSENHNLEDPYVELKKMFLEEGLPSQMIEMGKLRGVDDLSVPFGHILWTFALDLYVKLGGKPWTLERPMNNVNCLIGLGFGRDRKDKTNPIYIGIANIFDEGGQWLSLTSEDKKLTGDELLSIENDEYNLAGTSSFKLHQDLTQKITSDSLGYYNTSPYNRIATKVVLHKNGKVYESEALGFLQAFATNILDGNEKLSTARFALVSILKNHDMRMYGPEYANLAPSMRNTVTKGSAYILNENAALVATTGKDRFSYPGIGTPRPVLVERFVPSNETLTATGFNISQMYSIEEICEQILGLTRLHWGTPRNIRLPVTSEYAQRIARFVAKSKIRADLLLKLKKLWWI